MSIRHTPTHYGDPKTRLDKARKRIRQQREKNQAAVALVRIHWDRVRREKYGKNTVDESNAASARDQAAGDRPQELQSADDEIDEELQTEDA